MEVEIGIGKSGRRAYGFDDLAIVPSRRTRDPEDIDIFRIVDTPKDVVKLVVEGTKKRWWRPLDADLAKVAPTKIQETETPLAGAKSADTGEGTRYGKRPRRPEKAVARPGRKPPE